MSNEILNNFYEDNKKEEEQEEDEISLFGDKNNVALEYQRVELDKIKEENRSLKQDREQRKTFSLRLFIFTCLYMVASLGIVVMCGLGYMQLTDKVLITLLTTTLAEVIGMFNFVARYLFHHK